MRGPIYTSNKHSAPYGSGLTYIIETSGALASGSWTDAVTHSPGLLVSKPTISHTFNPSTPAKNFARLKITCP